MPLRLKKACIRTRPLSQVRKCRLVYLPHAASTVFPVIFYVFHRHPIGIDHCRNWISKSARAFGISTSSIEIILSFLSVKRQPFLWGRRQLRHVYLHDLIQLLGQNHASSRLPKSNLLHIRCLLPQVHHWRLIGVILLLSQILSLVVNRSAGVVPLRPTICVDDVRISSGSVGLIIDFGNFLTRLRNDGTCLRPKLPGFFILIDENTSGIGYIIH